MTPPTGTKYPKPAKASIRPSLQYLAMTSSMPKLLTHQARLSVRVPHHRLVPASKRRIRRAVMFPPRIRMRLYDQMFDRVRRLLGLPMVRRQRRGQVTFCRSQSNRPTSRVSLARRTPIQSLRHQLPRHREKNVPSLTFICPMVKPT